MTAFNGAALLLIVALVVVVFVGCWLDNPRRAADLDAQIVDAITQPRQRSDTPLYDHLAAEAKAAQDAAELDALNATWKLS